MRKRDLKPQSIQYCKNHKTSINDLDEFAKDFIDLDGKEFDTLLEYIRMVREEEIKKKKPLQKEMGVPEVCPKCGGIHIIRNGIQNGKQRYYCYGKTKTKYKRAIKPHSFTLDKSLPAMGRCELTLSDEREYVKNLLNHNSLGDIASDFNMATSTAFNWRHKILTVLKDSIDKNNVFGGRVEVDEIYFPLNFTGNVNALKNFVTKGKETNNKSAYLIYRPSKKLHKRGKSIKKAGLSKELVCVVTALNVPATGAIGKCSNLGKPSTVSVTNILEDLFGLDVVMVTDHEKSTHKFAVDHNIPVI
jgi:transposase-like protein